MPTKLRGKDLLKVLYIRFGLRDAETILWTNCSSSGCCFSHPNTRTQINTKLGFVHFTKIALTEI